MNEWEIYSAAAEIEDPQRRNEFLDNACGDDQTFRERIEQLLKNSHSEDSFLESPPTDLARDKTAGIEIATCPGDRIGPFKLLQKIGEGGMGVVFVAEQKQPVNRRVALKIIKPGMDSQQVVARFEAERQALALMDHPNIARALDVGTTGSGRPYFVMELIKGLPITKYCDEHRLSLRKRLELFIPVCQAVQHAHHKGVIHRDLKPSNILVTEYDHQAVPKIIDFGVAKALNQTLTDKTMFTQLGQIIGTLEYMSPEQAKVNQLDIDTRSDIYSLGVLLYELLTGTTPFDRERLRSAAWDELLRIIREEEPPRMSFRLSTSETLPSIAASRSIGPAQLGSMVRGELDWIVMKALDKERNRRYGTAISLGEDIQRYLDDEPVHACPPSAVYRFRKFARRNRSAMVSGSLLAAALVLGLLGTSWQARVASKQRHEALEAQIQANEKAAIATAVVDFLNDDLLGRADPDAPPSKNVSARDLLDRAAASIGERFRDQPLVEAEVRTSIGRAYTSLWMLDEADSQLQLAVELTHAELGENAYQSLWAEHHLLWVAHYRNEYRETIADWQSLLDRCREHFGSDDELTLETAFSLGSVYSHLGQYDQATALFHDVIQRSPRLLPKGCRIDRFSRTKLAQIHLNRDRWQKAEAMLRQLLEDTERVCGTDHPSTWRILAELAECLTKQHRFAEAEPLYLNWLEFIRRSKEERPLQWVDAVLDYSGFLYEADRYEDAEQQLRMALEVAEKAQGDIAEMYAASVRVALGNTLVLHRRFEEAESLIQQGYEWRKANLGKKHHAALSAGLNLAQAMVQRGQWTHATEECRDAEALIRQLLPQCQQAESFASKTTSNAKYWLAQALFGQKRLQESEDLLRELLNDDQNGHRLEKSLRHNIRSLLGVVLADSQKLAEAEDVVRETLKECRDTYGPNDNQTLIEQKNLASLLRDQNRLSEAESLYRNILERTTHKHGPNHTEVSKVKLALAKLALQLSQFAKAEALASNVYESLGEASGEAGRLKSKALLQLADCYRLRRKYADSERLLSTWLKEFSDSDHTAPGDIIEAKGLHAIILGKLGRWSEAECELAKLVSDSEQQSGPASTETIHNKVRLAETLLNQDRPDEAEQLLTGVYPIAQEQLGPADGLTLYCMRLLAHSLRGQHKYDEAETLYRERLVTLKQTDPESKGEIATAMNDVSLIRHRLKRREEAVDLLNELWSIRKRVTGDKAPSILFAQRRLAAVYAQAEQMASDLLTDQKDAPELKAKDILLTKCILAEAIMNQGRLEEAEQLFRKVVRERNQAHGNDHGDTCRSRLSLVDCLLRLGKIDEAEPVLEEVRRIERGANDKLSYKSLRLSRSLGVELWKRGEYARAEAIFREEIAALSTLEPNDPYPILVAKRDLAIQLTAQRRFAEAERLQREVYEARAELDGAMAPKTQELAAALFVSLFRQEKYHEAERLADERLKLCGDTTHPGKESLTWLSNQALLFIESGQADKAVGVYRSLSQHTQAVWGPNARDTWVVRQNLAIALKKTGHLSEAVALHRDLLRGANNLPNLAVLTPMSVAQLSEIAYLQLGSPDSSAAAALAEHSNDAPSTCYYKALLAIGTGNQQGYEKLVSQMEQQFADAEEASTIYYLVWTRLLRPSKQQKPGAQLKQAERLVESPGAGQPAHLKYQLAFAAALIRAGQTESALERLQELYQRWQDADPKPGELDIGYLSCFLALAHVELGDVETSRAWLARARKQIAREEAWNRQLTYKLLTEEIESRLATTARE